MTAAFRRHSPWLAGGRSLTDRFGFTVTEVLISVGILGALMALLIPAVLKSRASARRIECVNRLKQIGVATHSAAERNGALPTGNYAWDTLTVELGLPPNPPPGVWSGKHQYVHPVMLCPADPLATIDVQQRSYVLNNGSAWRWGPNANGYSTGLGDDRKPGSISDGLSQTAALSEMLVRSAKNVDDAQVLAHPRRYLWWTARNVDPQPGTEPEFIQACRNERTSQLPVAVWSPDFPGNGYDHFLPPNSPGCWNGTAEGRHGGNAIAPATSPHDGGVNVLWADGHVSFVSDSIDADLWRALGTVDGHETIGAWE